MQRNFLLRLSWPAVLRIGQNTKKVKHWKTFDVTLDYTLDVLQKSY
jgi:hypothetical protein